ncbi:MAG: hypothetical protein K6B51_04855, partial [Bacilli bacterium]|nr:hypothetical protein [Bacilli bacterium]
IIPIAIGVLLSLVTTLATARFRYANIIVTVIYTLFLVGFSLLSILTRNSSASSLAQSFGAIGRIFKWLNPTFILFEMALTTNPLIAIAFAGINVLVLAGTILFLALCFDRLHDIVSSASLKPHKADVTMANKNETRTLLSLEFKRLMGSKMYFANAIMGAIMAIVGSSIFLFTMKRAFDSSSAEVQAAMNLLIIPIFIVISSWILGMSSPSVSAISIEGKHFWLIKSLPIDYRKYMRVKLLFPLILYVPASLIASTIAVIFCHESVLDIVMAYLIPLSYVVLTTFMGLIINLRHYKLKWSNETEAVKNSIAVLIALLIDVGIIIVFGTPVIVVTVLTGKALYTYIPVLAAAVVTDIILYLWLRKNFARKIEGIEDF